MKKLTALLLALCLVLSLASFASADEAGKVYYLNFKPEADEAWQALAKHLQRHPDLRNGEEGRRPHPVPDW